MPREDIALLAPALLAAAVLVPLAVARWTSGPRPLDAFLVGVPLRLALNPLTYYALEFVKAAYGPAGSASDRALAFKLYALLSLAREVGSNLMFVAQMAFFARIADPAFGGTYMTLLNTVANLGGKWPPSLALYGIDALESLGVADAFAVELAACTAAGLAWFAYFGPRVRALQDVPPARWHGSGDAPPRAGAPLAGV